MEVQSKATTDWNNRRVRMNKAVRFDNKRPKSNYFERMADRKQ